MRLIKHLGSRGEEDPKTHNIEVVRLPANVVGKDLDEFGIKVTFIVKWVSPQRK